MLLLCGSDGGWRAGQGETTANQDRPRWRWRVAPSSDHQQALAVISHPCLTCLREGFQRGRGRRRKSFAERSTANLIEL